MIDGACFEKQEQDAILIVVVCVCPKESCCGVEGKFCGTEVKNIQSYYDFIVFFGAAG